MSETRYTIHLISNTHWDREWYMSHEAYLVRLVEMTDRLLDILEKKPGYRFVMDGQFMMLKDYLDVRPENRERVKLLMEKGQLKVGPWYSQPLETLVSGEAMVRNLQYGLRETEKLGPAMRFSYEVDEFGHASQTPQILAGFGIGGAIAWRGMPPEARSAFVWESPDGSAIWMLWTNDGYGEATDLPANIEDYTEVIDGDPIPRPGLKSKLEALKKLREPKADTNQLMWLNGIDHSFAQEDILEVLPLVESLDPNLTVRQSTPEEFFDAVKKDYAERALSLGRVSGELMWPGDLLSSTHSCHPSQKLKHYQTERTLERRLEPAALMGWLSGKTYPAWAVDRAWEYVLQNHAHDSLGCTSVDEVYQQVMARYVCAESLGNQVREDSLRAVMAAGGDPGVWIFNTISFPQKGVQKVTLTIPRGLGDGSFTLETPDGREVPIQILNSFPMDDVRYNPRRGHPVWTPATRVVMLCDLPEVAGMGYVKLAFRKAAPKTTMGNLQKNYLASMTRMENAHLSAEITADGRVNLLDKKTGRTYSSLFLWEDDGEVGNAYVHVRPQTDRVCYSMGQPADIHRLYDGSLGTAFEIIQTLRVPAGLNDLRTARSQEMGEIKTKITLVLKSDARHMEAQVEILSGVKDHRLRLLFPTGLSKAQVARGGQPFDVVDRSIAVEEFPTKREENYATHPMQDFCDVAESNCGLSVAAEGIYEYECTDTRDRVLALTMLRAMDNIDNASLLKNPDYRMHSAEEQGKLVYNLAIFPHDGDWREIYGDIQGFLTPPEVKLTRAEETSVMPGEPARPVFLPGVGSVLTLSGKNLMVTAMKKALMRDSIILRVLNYGTEEAKGSLTFTFPGKKIAQVYETNLEEKRLAPLSHTDGKVDFTLRKAGLLTLEFVPEEA